jgi:uncharacterized peroxidase-related enzyme
MQTLKPLTIDAAPEAARATLQNIEKRFGFVPNLMATFAKSPALLNGYVGLDAEFHKSSFTATERQLIFLAASVENRCDYCVATHSTALRALKFGAKDIRAVRDRAALDDPKADALVTLTRELVSERGFVAPATRARFLQAGFTDAALMEVLIGVALKVMSNYLDHLNPIAIDAAFRGEV